MSMSRSLCFSVIGGLASIIATTGCSGGGEGGPSNNLKCGAGTAQQGEECVATGGGSDAGGGDKGDTPLNSTITTATVTHLGIAHDLATPLSVNHPVSLSLGLKVDGTSAEPVDVTIGLVDKPADPSAPVDLETANYCIVGGFQFNFTDPKVTSLRRPRPSRSRANAWPRARRRRTSSR
jgi:hypothetical protein